MWLAEQAKHVSNTRLGQGALKEVSPYYPFAVDPSEKNPKRDYDDYGSELTQRCDRFSVSLLCCQPSL